MDIKQHSETEIKVTEMRPVEQVISLALLKNQETQLIKKRAESIALMDAKLADIRTKIAWCEANKVKEKATLVESDLKS